VPLDTERGYHLEWDMVAPRLTRPTCPTSRGFYLCPMAGRLRVAGTVELGGLTAPPSPHRLARLEEGARAILPGLTVPSRSWMGFRPSVPDSLPVVGPGRAGARVLHAYGHGHIGLTLAPITAELVERCLAGADDGQLAALSPLRF
jgi:D-amino-acid dehydrogenase